MAEWVYTTRRMMLVDERRSIAAALSEATSALSRLLSGEITSYTLGHWSITRSHEDLEKLQKWINAQRVRLDEIDCLLTGRPMRKVSTCVYANPAFVRWGWPI